MIYVSVSTSVHLHERGCVQTSARVSVEGVRLRLPQGGPAPALLSTHL